MQRAIPILLVGVLTVAPNKIRPILSTTIAPKSEDAEKVKKETEKKKRTTKKATTTRKKTTKK